MKAGAAMSENNAKAKYVRYYDTREYYFTSESVSHGHPDKVSDQISDAILDAYLKQDPYSRVAIETLVTTDLVVVAGEVRGPESVKKDIESVIRNQIKTIGYEHEGFNWNNVEIINRIHNQSAEIAQGVDNKDPKLEGAGDQGIMFGYACRETEDLMPAAIYYSHKILRLIFEDVKSGKLKGLGPDAKSQASLKYRGNDPIGINNLVVSIQHDKSYTQAQLRDIIRPYIAKTFPEGWSVPEKDFYVNPTGSFILGGPQADTGLTGRKIIVDTYGGSSPHGGGAFSGKDPTKVDRSAAYVARYLAKNVVASGLANACTIELAYAIGVAKPLALYVNTHSTGENGIEDHIIKKINENMDLTPWGIRNHLKLHAPIYLPTASYGHFGRKPTDQGHFTWEKTDLADKLK
jgi:S-adenosylmethionine synthetase